MTDRPGHPSGPPATGGPVLEAIARAVVDGPGGPVLRAPGPFPPLPLPAGALVLTRFLYAHYYTGDPQLAHIDDADHLELLGLRVSDPGFLDRLRAANPGHGYLQPGWTILDTSDRQWRVRRGGLTLLVDPRRHLDPVGDLPAEGDVVAVRFPKDAALASPGFYVAFSDAGPAHADDLVRIYLDLRAEHAVGVTAELLRGLLGSGIAYTYKVVSDPQRYGRRDSAVLYAGRPDVERVLSRVMEVRDRRPAALDPAVPAFTRQVAPGVALADDPGGGLSFGEHRCGLVAAVVESHVRRSPGTDGVALLAALRQGFRDAGLDPDRTELAPSRVGDGDERVEQGRTPAWAG